MSIYSKTAAGWVEVAGGAGGADLTSWGRVVGEPEGAVTSAYINLEDGSNWQYWEFNQAGDYEIDLGNGGLFWVLAVGGGSNGNGTGSYENQGQPGLVNEGLWEFGPGVHPVKVGRSGDAPDNRDGAKMPGPSSIGDYGVQGKVAFGQWETGRGAVGSPDQTGYKSRITGDEMEYATGAGGLDRPGRPGAAPNKTANPGCVIIATRIDVEQLAPAPAELAPAPVLGAPVKVSGSADVVEYIVRQKDGSRKKIYMLPGNTTDNGGENVFEVTLGAGTLNAVMVGGGGQGSTQGAGGAGGVIGTGCHVPIILPIQGTATYTIKVAGVNWGTQIRHTRPGMNTSIAVQGQEPFAVAVGGGDGVGVNNNIATGGGLGASGGGAGQWANIAEYWSTGTPNIPGQGHQGAANEGGIYGGGGGYGSRGGGDGYPGNGGAGFDFAAAFDLETSDGATAAFLDAVSMDGIIAGGGAVGLGVAVGGGGKSNNAAGTGTSAKNYTGSGGGGQKADAAGNSLGGCGAVYIITDA